MAKTTKELCLRDLQRRILSLDIEPGSDLDEATLCEAYSLSRTPLREVLQRLAGDGFIRLEAHRGAQVASMDFATMRTFFQTAPLIYANIARLAAENRRTSQIDDLKDAQLRFAKATSSGDSAEAALNNHRFHAVIGDMAHNQYLVASLNRLLIDHTRMSQTFYRPASPAESVLVRQASQHHDAMISAIQAQEGAMMMDLTLQHWDLSRDRMERFVHPDPLPHDVISMKDRSNAV